MSIQIHHRLAAAAMSALEAEEPDMAQALLSGLPLDVLRRLGENADRLSQLAFNLAGPRDEQLPPVPEQLDTPALF